MKKLTPLKAIRAKCRDCSDGLLDIRDCNIQDCCLWPYRSGKRSKEPAVKTPIRKVTRSFCLGCCADKPKEVRLCPCMECPLWEYRLRTRPKIEILAKKQPNNEPFSERKMENIPI